LSGPQGIAVDASGNLYVVESGASLIRKITPPGVLTTIAGAIGGGFADGPGDKALFAVPEGITIDATGNLYVSDLGNNRIRKITPAGTVSTVAGGAPGFANGSGPNARFNAPSDITIDAAGNLYVMDVNNHIIRKIQY
jgi:sugar lactone lactonase YvrE